MPRKIKQFEPQNTPPDRMAHDWPTTGGGTYGRPRKSLPSAPNLRFIRGILDNQKLRNTSGLFQSPPSVHACWDIWERG
jgi:hypothetical protein